MLGHFALDPLEGTVSKAHVGGGGGPKDGTALRALPGGGGDLGEGRFAVGRTAIHALGTMAF